MLPLKERITYGPVNSRRLGRSLGINLLPAGGKVCSFLVEGAVSNSAGPAFERWLDTLARLHPVQAQVYSSDRPVPEAGVERVPPERLQQLAARAAAQTGLDVRAYWPHPR